METKSFILVVGSMNKEEKKAYDKAYRQENKEEIKAYRQENKEEIKAQRKAYRQENKEKIKAYNKAYQQEHKEEIKAYDKAYKQENRERRRSWEAKRRSAKLNRTPAFANLDNIKQVFLHCPKNKVVDHEIPLQGKIVSGLHVETNLQYLTSSENGAKSNSFEPRDYI